MMATDIIAESCDFCAKPATRRKGVPLSALMYAGMLTCKPQQLSCTQLAIWEMSYAVFNLGTLTEPGLGHIILFAVAEVFPLRN